MKRGPHTFWAKRYVGTFIYRGLFGTCTYLGLFRGLFGMCTYLGLFRGTCTYQTWLFMSMKVVRAWYVSWNDWNVLHVPQPLFIAPVKKVISKTSASRWKLHWLICLLWWLFILVLRLGSFIHAFFRTYLFGSIVSLFVWTLHSIYW